MTHINIDCVNLEERELHPKPVTPAKPGPSFGSRIHVQNKMAGTSPAMMNACAALTYAGTSCAPKSFSLAGALAVAQRKFQV
jgi:hypothetical protein